MKRLKITMMTSILLGLMAILLLSGSFGSTTAEAQTFYVIGYSTSWSGAVTDIQFDKLTHINYAFLLPDNSGNGQLQPLDNPAKLQQLVSAAHANGVKVLISVGGWNDGNDQGFEIMAANPSARTTFVNNMVNFVNTYNLDGVDIDWEYPDPGTSAQNYAALMQALSTAMHSRGKLLTAAVVALGYTGGGVPTEVFGYVDYLMIMAYDGGSGANHSPYSYAVDSLNYWRGRGLPQSKAVLGVPFYGRPTWAAYQALVANDPQAPYKDTSVYNGTTTYYNGIQTIKDKTSLAMQQGGGIMMWELAQDTANDTSLLRAIAEVVGGGPLPTTVPTNTPQPGDCTYPAWHSSTVYVGGDRVTHNNQEWRAKWWTQGEEPGTTGQWGVWEHLGPCGGGSNPTPTPTPTTPGNTPPPPTATPGGSAPPWAPNTYYSVGYRVTYNGSLYECRQAHTSIVTWEPPNTPALWLLVN